MTETIVAKTVGSKYVCKLTPDEIEEIKENCFKRNLEGAPIGEITDKYVHDIDVFITTDLGYEFYLYDFFLASGHGLYTTKNAMNFYIALMYKKFGRQYLEEYFDRKYNVKSLELRYLQAKEDCKKAVEEFKNYLDARESV